MTRKNLGFLGFPKYEISDSGVVYSLDYRRSGKEAAMSPSLNTKGYCQVRLVGESGKVTFRVHRLVALAFIPNPQNLPQVNHKDENKTNNHVENLEWCTNEYNMTYNDGMKRRGLLLRGKPKPHFHKRVEQLTVDGVHVAFFESVAEARKQTGATHISHVCLNKNIYHTSGGYKWRYV